MGQGANTLVAGLRATLFQNTPIQLDLDWVNVMGEIYQGPETINLGKSYASAGWNTEVVKVASDGSFSTTATVARGTLDVHTIAGLFVQPVTGWEAYPGDTSGTHYKLITNRDQAVVVTYLTMAKTLRTQAPEVRHASDPSYHDRQPIPRAGSTKGF